MSEATSHALAPDEKATPVMVYEMNSMCWGEVVTKELVRVNTYLRTLAPDYVSLRDAKIMPIGGSGTKQPIACPELHIRTPKVIAFHLLPPADEPPDYDPTEANRMMEPVTALVGPFRFDGHLRISTIMDLYKALEISKEVFVSLYDVAASCPTMPALGVIRAPLVLVRRDVGSFGSRV